MGVPDVDDLPGYRRRFRVVPGPGRVSCELEDDIHCMVVVVHHDGETATSVEGAMRRAPWTTCPGAEQVVKETFTGVRLEDFPVRGRKKANCTHLYDLATLAAAHAHRDRALIIDILVSDPVDGRRYCELRHDGESLLAWTDRQGTIEAPEEFAGMSLVGDMTPWIDPLPLQLQEAARLLRWACLVAHGRQIPIAEQSDATRMPPNCYTFQPERAVIAVRVGEIRDFSTGSRQPLGEYVSPQ